MVSHLIPAVQLEEIVNCLKDNLQLKKIYQDILYQKIIRQKSAEMNLIVTSEEIQIEADKIRREKQLEKAADTLAWLNEQMITADEWESGIRDNLLRQKLAKTLFAQDVDNFFNQNKLNFEQVLLYQIVVPYEKLALEIFYQIEEEEMSFYQAAHLYDIDEKRRYQCGYEGKLYRFNIKPDLASVIFSAKTKEVILPVKTNQEYHILMVEEFIPAELTSEVYDEIINNMFDEWLASELNYLLHDSEQPIPTTDP
ncbi:peptidylprolyl isomerase [Crocosphaera sp. UHCC 0190]|uniref:peptidylprolyl isomerase n=1 Tax=Crocosphaera sp. UHCC 0190 TaxID=3110246 RepID=UPI002B1EEF07|nr:peptidylprolyl isomerase [Crocosphaera sp. UHCC 0190]MEA5512272.1 peptidylprolyl isomerase [Crocosphaera sp. UHCC 0190]